MFCEAVWRALASLVMVLAVGCGAAGAAQAAAPPRLALVVANSGYRTLPALPNAARDGDAIAAALTTAKFVDASGAGAVRPRRDLTDAQLRQELADFAAALARAGDEAFGVVYFSGHGVTLGSGGNGALLPIDQGAEVQPGLVTRTAITDQLLGAGARTVVVILDMCRSPLAAPPAEAEASKGLRIDVATAAAPTGSKGLTRYAPAQRRPDQGYLVAYSTSPDQLAFDSGVFSRILAEEIRRPSQNVADVFKRVSDRVALGSGAKAWQKPTFDYGLQGDPPCFVSCSPQADGQRFYDCANCPWMRVVPAGDGLLGSPASEEARGRDEPLVRSVRVAKPFALAVFELTLSEWAACELDGACRKRPNWSKDNPNPLIPATHISYEDAQAYVAWLSARSGRAYRLPTEEEWEYAARAGASSAFTFGDDITPSQANYDHSARYRGSPVLPYRGYPEAVTGYPANGFGLAQMEGNVWEWTSACVAPETAARCKARVLRGGSFESAPAELRLANRFPVPDDKVRADVGLRVARDLDPDEGRALP
ncbi:MAG: SUMF1/EgtB/PvdO family nonheme iron enzyme [Phenylobacterium sp.]|uniref:SUMF1/EgtB/PvdO family nonheme iron enzyme n=1 Tax=Phenylobacterium sp. TaxID=1871053 RepID=UPI001A521D69|nr:SUMF1/EgtB/PvdO family nonheme iron enzyme [Phenylobacterium sp.]MBL8770641.1 SUMF1/EgtB/PvdO family nonheme iron enzyme [Phenylobacterium sp.]